MSQQNLYPERLVQSFKNYGVDIYTLPVLDLKNRGGNTDYIDFLTPEDMTAPIMRFVDKFRRPGLAFLLRGPKNESGVVSVFQRYTENSRTWVYGTNIYGFLSAYSHAHDPEHTGSCIDECPKCPAILLGCSKSLDYVDELLTNKHPVYTVVSVEGH